MSQTASSRPLAPPGQGSIGAPFLSLTIIALLAAFPIALAAGINLDSSGFLSIDKATKFLPLIFLIAVMLKDLRWRLINPALRLPLSLAAIYASCYLLRSLADLAAGRGGEVAGKELVRIGSFLVVLLAACTTFYSDRQKKGLIVGVCAVAAATFPFAVQHSLSGSAENSGRYVGEVLRAGSELVDANELGGFFAMASVFALALVLITRSLWGKLLAFALFGAFHVGRALTFSTGSLLNVAVATLIFAYLVRRTDRSAGRKLVSLLTVVVIGAAVALVVTGYYEVIFYRVALSDEYVAEATVLSRVAQYVGFGDLILREPQGLLWGYGSERLIEEIGVGFDLHNSFLRPLGVAGVVAFLSFLFLPLSLLRARKWAVDASAHARITSAAGMGVFVAWCIQAMTVPGDTHLIFWVMMSLFVVLCTARVR